MIPILMAILFVAWAWMAAAAWVKWKEEPWMNWADKAQDGGPLLAALAAILALSLLL